MIYKIALKKEVKKFLAKHSLIAKIIYLKTRILSTDINSNNLDIKKLKGYNNKYRLRIGKYRFLYEIIENEILIYFYEADGRGDVYK